MDMNSFMLETPLIIPYAQFTPTAYHCHQLRQLMPEDPKLHTKECHTKLENFVSWLDHSKIVGAYFPSPLAHAYLITCPDCVHILRIHGCCPIHAREDIAFLQHHLTPQQLEFLKTH
jgi:hypothetical protein